MLNNFIFANHKTQTKWRNSQKETNETNSKEIENLHRSIIRRNFALITLKQLYFHTTLKNEKKKEKKVKTTDRLGGHISKSYIFKGFVSTIHKGHVQLSNKKTNNQMKMVKESKQTFSYLDECPISM